MMKMRPQPPRGPSQPDDLTNYQAGRIFAQIVATLVNGLAYAIRMTKSLRVGSGTGLASLDGSDGEIIANGASAALVTGDRASAGTLTYVAFYLNGTLARCYTTAAAGDIWQWDTTSGLFVQPALAAITAGTNITLDPVGGGMPPTGTRQIKPAGLIEVFFSMKATAAIAAFSTLGTITTAGHFPGGTIPFTLRDHTAGGAVPGWITAGGAIGTDTPLTAGHNYSGVIVY